jgi:GTP pyrophosphokinase
MLEKVRAVFSGEENRETFFNRVSMYFPSLDYRYQLILKAYGDAKDAFRGKYRDGGDRYFEHIRAVVLILIDYLRVRDYELIVAAILHDIVEDIPSWTIERVRLEYGERVAYLVEYLSKPEIADKVLRNKVYHQRFESAPREFFLIKLADRLHNLLTLWDCKPKKRHRKIEETRLHYVPYAERHLILLHELEAIIEELEANV